MFRHVVYKNIQDESYTLCDTGTLGEGVRYLTLEALPDDIKLKVKQLMWVSPDDQTITETLGIRVGENTFWLL